MSGNQKLEAFEISPDADTAGIRPQDLAQGGELFTIRTDLLSNQTCTKEQRMGKNGKPFPQYTLYVRGDGKDRVLQYLFERDLAPLARKFGANPAEWVGREVKISPTYDGTYYGVKLEAQ